MDTSIECLASTQDTKELCYEYDMPIIQEDDISIEQPPLDISRDLTESVETPALPSSTPIVATVATVTVDEVPITGEEIIRTLVARKLKKPILQIETSKSVKELCGGAFN